MQSLAATAVVLFVLGAAAAGVLLGKLVGARSGFCVALAYLLVLFNVAPNANFDGFGLLLSADVARNPYYQRSFEATFVILVGVIIYEFVRKQLRDRRHQAQWQAQAAEPAQQVDEQQLALQEQLQAPTYAAAEPAPHFVCDQEWTLQRKPKHAWEAQLNELDVGLDDSSCTEAPLQHERQHACTDDEGEDEEIWRTLPDAVFIDVFERLAPADQGSVRATCTHWYDAGKRTITRLRPCHFPVKHIVVGFPSLKALDLSNCTKDVTPNKLRYLRCLPGLEDVIMGCHHRLIASSITNACIAELVTLSNLRSLNLSQCVHVGDGGLMSLVYLSGLRSLNISGCVAVTDIGIMMIAQLTNLTSLDMPWCVKVTNIGLKALAPLTKLANLNISGCQLITEPGLSCLAVFTNLEKLSLLNLGYSKVCVTDAALGQLSGLAKLRSLNVGSMQLCNKMVTDASIRMISSSYKELTQLGLMSLDVSDAGVQHLAQLSNLQALNLRGCTRVSSASLKYLSALTRITDLCLLHNSKLELDDACLASLAKLPNLQILGLGNFQVSSKASDTCLLPLAASKQLLVLSIGFFNGRFGPETCSMVAQMSNLQHLDLQGSQHADASLLQAVGQISSLQSLHLSRCTQVDDIALQHITGLSNLHTLNISFCSKVTDTGFAALTKLQNLTHLLAQQCKDVTDAGIALLGRLTKLQVLDLSLCERITGSGFVTFSNCRQMATLSLNGCSSLNDGGLRAIGRIVSLTKLDLSNCQLITDIGVAYLRGLGELTGLNLALCIRIGDAAMASIAAGMQQLATLKVNGCIRITDIGVNEVCNIPSLLTLHLDRCVHVTDLGLQCLTRLTGLTSLRISRCPSITDAGVAQLSKLSRLSTLSLAQCPRVTDVGLMALAPLTTLASLEF